MRVPTASLASFLRRSTPGQRALLVCCISAGLVLTTVLPQTSAGIRDQAASSADATVVTGVSMPEDPLAGNDQATRLSQILQAAGRHEFGASLGFMAASTLPGKLPSAADRSLGIVFGGCWASSPFHLLV